MPVPGGRGRRKTLDLNPGSGIARSVYASLLAHLGRTSEAYSEITPGAGESGRRWSDLFTSFSCQGGGRL